MSTLKSFSHSKYVMPMIVERAGFVIVLSSDSPVVQGDDEWLENHLMYCAWWSIMEYTNHPYICAVPPKCSWITLSAQIMKKCDYIIVALVDETYTNKQKKILHHTGNRPKSPRYTFCQWWTSVYNGSTRRGLETFKSLFLCRSTKIKHPSLQKRLNINNGTSWWNIH